MLCISPSGQLKSLAEKRVIIRQNSGKYVINSCLSKRCEILYSFARCSQAPMDSLRLTLWVIISNDANLFVTFSLTLMSLSNSVF